MKRFFYYWMAVCFGMAMISCADGNGFATGNSVSVVSWNVQTFFDAVKDGSEYSDFLKSENWNEKAYSDRVEKLCTTMVELNADVYVFQEIENEAVLYDICNGLAGYKWNSGACWNYACFYKEEGSSIGCAVISRYQLKDFTNHNLDVRTNVEEQPALRAIGKVTVCVKDREVVLLVNHWKSKNTGEVETDFWRQQQENVLAKLILECIEENTCEIIVCGDFNKDITEFYYVENNTEGNIALNCKCTGCERTVIVKSPWFNESGDFVTETGSYFYKSNWERIDNFFLYGDMKVLRFEVCNNGPWVKENGEPYAFKCFNCEGYSDHLPIKLTFSFW